MEAKNKIINDASCSGCSKPIVEIDNQFVTEKVTVEGDFVVVENIQELKTLAPNYIEGLKSGKFKGVQILGYYEKNDTPSPIIYYLSDTIEPENGGSIFETSDIKLEHVFTGATNVLYWGLKRNNNSFSNNIVAKKMWDYCITTKTDILFPSGVYTCINSNWPFRQEIVTTLLDCKNITITGEGAATVLQTISQTGADVLQLNGLKNLNVKNLTVSAILNTTTGAGSNGVSITNGFDNLFIDIRAINLPYVDKGSYLDGGKGFSIQPSTTSQECGVINANVIAINCAYGVGADLDLPTMATKKTSIKITGVIEKCYRGVVVACPASSAPLSNNFSLGISIESQTINCQQDVVLGRTHGVNVRNQITTTQTIENLRLNPQGSAWKATDTLVMGFDGQYCKNGQINIFGNKGDSDYKVRLGGSTAGSSGLNGSSSNNIFHFDIAGTASTDILDLNSGGNVVLESEISITTRTSTTIPDSFYLPSRLNNVFLGTINRQLNPQLAERVSLCMATDGKAETGAIYRSGNVTTLQGKASSTPSTIVVGLADKDGTVRLGIKNGNGIVVDSMNSPSAIGTVYKGKIAVYDMANNLIGYLGLYNTV